MKANKTPEQLQRMQTRPASGAVVGTTSGIVVPEEQFSGDKLQSKPGSLPTSRKGPYWHADMEPPSRVEVQGPTHRPKQNNKQ